MPIYEYRCSKCGHHLEVMQGINDKPLRKCQECSGKLEKLISRTSFHLKGGGWYDSGYSKGSGSKGAKAGDAASKSDSGSKSESGTKSDSGSGGKSGKGDLKAASA